MSGDFESWNQEPVHKAPEPNYHWLEKKRGDRAKLAVKWLAILGIAIYIILHFMGVIR